ncbi:hypothetical protein DY000_02006671 [Brassica cretica]|uniref:DUF4283 domain-containing protein n=1 Tax=Brassica cretica TaxID=69181 RepID=A0ABQ7BYR6_BRACR|nr:hypothetical protein DY000_02006671 [Brassica cretica]
MSSLYKTTVLFRIENDALRQKVLSRRYWHVAVVPLAGLKCLSSPVGKFVKLHPFTERCSRLDVAQMLLEVNLHEPHVESVTFTNQECYKVEVGVSSPWFPTRCNICSNWGHKGPECNMKQVVILSKSTENKTRENEIGENEKVEGELEGDNEVSLDLEKDAGKNGNSGSGIAFVGALLAELETLPAPILQNEVGTVQSASNEEGVGKRSGKEIVTEEQPEWNDVPYRNRPSLDEPEVTQVSFDVASGTISPSRFKVLETLNEEEEGLDVLE